MGVTVRRLPGPRQPLMQEQARPRPGGGVDRLIQHPRALQSKGLVRSDLGIGVLPGATGQGGEQPGPDRTARHRADPRPDLGEGVDRPRIPETAGHILQRRRLRQLGCIEPAIEQPTIGNHRQRRNQLGLAADGGAGRARLGGGRSVLIDDLAAQPGDVLYGVQAAARVRRVGPGGDAAAADIGVEGLGLDSEPCEGLATPDPADAIHGRVGRFQVTTSGRSVRLLSLSGAHHGAVS